MDFLTTYRTEIETTLRTFLANNTRLKKQPSDAVLSSGIEHATLIGGKRIRPILGLCVFDALGGSLSDREATKTALIAIELMHAASLVQDDLPCMDNDPLRRGHPTVWKKYGEAQAVLISDALMMLAFDAITQPPLDAETKIKLIKKLTHSFGLKGLIGGQAADLCTEKALKVSWNNLLDTQQRKTGALLSASAEFGALIAKSSSASLETIITYAESLGLSFQLRDDLLDFEGDPEQMGKKIRKDFEKKGAVYLLGLEEARKKLKECTDIAQKIARELRSKNLEALAEYIAKREQ
jgi:geranylgeranyl pyrophosphate synthase